MSALERLGRVSNAYEREAQAYGAVALAAANAEADHRRARARRVLEVKASEERMSHAEAEARAEADDEVSALYRERVTTAAVADAHRERLRQLRSQIDVGRSYVAAERASDDLHARSAP